MWRHKASTVGKRKSSRGCQRAGAERSQTPDLKIWKGREVKMQKGGGCIKLFDSAALRALGTRVCKTSGVNAEEGDSDRKGFGE